MVVLVDSHCCAKTLERMTEWEGVSGVLFDSCLFYLYAPFISRRLPMARVLPPPAYYGISGKTELQFPP